MKQTVSVFALLASLSLGSVSAQEPDSASYISSEGYSTGWVNVLQPQGGIYIYTPPKPDARITAKAFLIGRPERQTYQLFSAQEEEALWQLREEKGQTDVVAARNQKTKFTGHHRAQKLSFEWPKVVVRGSEICVPILDYSESSDWREHLTCWSPEVNHVE